MRGPLGVAAAVTLALALVGPATAANAAPAPGAGTHATHRAVLAGELGFEGGAYPGKLHPTPGIVEVAFVDQPLVLLAKVGPSGHFWIRLAPGAYLVTGCGGSASPHQPPTQGSKPVKVTLQPGEVDHIKLVWALVP
jgi:hypothetical protein